jgi:peroxiredoxin
MTRLNFLLAIALVSIFSSPLRAQDPRSSIHETAEQVQPLLPGMKAPSFTVQDVKGNTVAIDPASLEKPLVLTFYRGGWCPFCNMYLAEMRHAEKELTGLGFDIWFISIDKPELLYASLDQPDVAYTIYSDSSLDATRAFGLAFRVDDDTYERYIGYDINLEEASGETHHVLPAPSTFIIGTDGIINFQYTNPDYKVRLHPDVLLAAARAYVNEADQRLYRAWKARMKTQQE